MFKLLISNFVLTFLLQLIFGLVLVFFLGVLIGAKFSPKISPLFSSRFVGLGILLVLAVKLVRAALEFYGTYYLWMANPMSRPLLPPYTPISYFWSYGWQRFAKADVFALASAVTLFGLMILLNKIFQERFFYPKEPYLAALGTVAVGWPNCFLFLALVLVPGLIFHFGRLARQLIFKKSAWGGSLSEADALREQDSGRDSDFRLNFLYFWLPAALVVWFWGDKLAQIVQLAQFKI